MRRILGKEEGHSGDTEVMRPRATKRSRQNGDEGDTVTSLG